MQKTVALVPFSNLPIIPFNIMYFHCARRENLTCPTQLWMQYYSQTCATYTPTRIYPTGTKRNAIFRTILCTHTQHPSAQQWISVYNEKQTNMNINSNNKCNIYVHLCQLKLLLLFLTIPWQINV